MTVVLPVTGAAPAGSAGAWRTHLRCLAVGAIFILAVFRNDVVAMVRIWLTSSTFAHCVLIAPILAWLVWQRLPELRRLRPRAWTPGLAVVALGASVWLLGDAGSLAIARHFGLVLMFQGLVIACLGPEVARGLAFPLFYGFFLVPAGEELVPLMQTVTAKICMALLALVGIPAHIEGVFITTPGGLYEVAEACSGVKFLVAMAAYAALVANLCFRSWRRRLPFLIAATVIPVLANGVRAWGTIYVASFTSNAFASGFDHILYGWIFFGLVIALVMAASWRFFDRGPLDPWFDPAALQGPRAVPGLATASLMTSFAAAGIALAPAAWGAAVAAGGTRPVPHDVALPTPPGWHRVDAAHRHRWQPRFDGADLVRLGHYRDAAGHEVDVAVAVFARQEEGRELVGYGQGAIDPDGAWAWTASGPPPPGGRLDRIVSFGTVRDVATFYRVGASLTGSPLEVKLATMKVRLLGGPQRAVALLVSAEAPAQGVSPRPAIDAFLAALGPVDRVADAAAEGR